ncbi:monocarboxylate transporter 12-like [Glandiceps talaboti]
MQQKEHHNTSIQPPDGGYGWVVAISGMVSMLLTGGVVYTSGIFLVEFVEYFQRGAEEAAWIGAILGGVYNGSGIISATLTKKFGSRVVLIISGLLTMTGFILSVLAPTLPVLYFTIGVLVGLGFGLPPVAAIMHISAYFSHKYVFANGICFSGYAIGPLIASPLLYLLIGTFGWRGAVLVIGGISANMMVCGALMRPLNPINFAKSKSFDDLPDQNATTHAHHNTEKVINCVGETNNVPRKQVNNISPTAVYFGDATDAPIKHGDERKHNWKSSCSKKLHRVSSTFGVDLFVKNRTFCIVCFAQLLEGFGSSTVNSHLVNYAVTSVILGLSHGTRQPLIPVSLRECVGEKDMGMALGWDYFTLGLGHLLGPPFSGWLFDVTGNYKVAFYSTGGLTLIGGILDCIAPNLRLSGPRPNVK